MLTCKRGQGCPKRVLCPSHCTTVLGHLLGESVLSLCYGIWSCVTTCITDTLLGVVRSSWCTTKYTNSWGVCPSTGLTYCRQGEVSTQEDDDDYFWDGVLWFLTISDNSNVLVSFAGLLDSDKHFNCDIASRLGLMVDQQSCIYENHVE